MRAELSAVIAANEWPTSTNATYFIFLPAGIDECFSGAGRQPRSRGCADTRAPIRSAPTTPTSARGQPPLYAVMPWADVAGCQTG